MPIKKIMVVDDSRALREAAATELRTAGYEVSEAADGIAFVKEAGKRPDCRFLPIWGSSRRPQQRFINRRG